MELLRKDSSLWRVQPNLRSYDETCASFSWSQARAGLDGLPGGRGLNIAHEAVDRHALGERRDHVAIRWLGRRGERRDFSYADLMRETSRFANVLAALGVVRGDRVFALLGRIPELYVCALGTLKLGAVFSPLFSAFGPEPVRQRLTLGGGKILITTPALYEKKVRASRQSLPDLRHVLLTDTAGKVTDVAGTLDLTALMAQAQPRFEIPATDPEDIALLHFTSGTTGTPKGAVHVHDAVVAHHVTGRLALDLHPDDVFWCTADPGWVTGMSYGLISPLTNAVTSIVDEGDFDADRWYATIEQQRVSVWYTAPTAVRMLMKVGLDAARDHDLSSLRFIASVGEPLNPEGVVWGQQAFGTAIHDNWWQTETGGIMIANFAAMDVKPGSMGRPLPGVEAAIVRRDSAGNAVVREGRAELVEDPGEHGELALRPGWPSMFRGYLGEDARYRKCFAAGWYLTGDLVRRDAEGYYWFVGRGDDVIKSAGHLIGPFEVESALMEHPAVAEAGVIGKPDAIAGEIVKAFVTLKKTWIASEELRRDIVAF
ncbi:MAG: acetate--CoA ligase, partial [Deltaproteobacteria bacterium]|nr:acetate--CoA ligase [Deltaproteobacteria bacterium]